MSAAPLPLNWTTRLLLAGSALLVLAGAAAFYLAAQGMNKEPNGTAHRVEVNKTSCEPMDITVDAGTSTFEIHNRSDRPIEWEILDGVMVVEERENIAPGFHARLNAKLRPGTYDITCGLLTNPRGKLTVVASEAFTQSNSSVPVTAFIGPLSEIRVYLGSEVNALLRRVEALDQQIKVGNLEAAKTAWHEARLPYRRIEAFTQDFSDLENAIDILPDYLEKRELDPSFTGFHRIEYGLWQQGSTASVATVSQKLVEDVQALKMRLKTQKLAPAKILSSAKRQADDLAQMLRGQDDNRWANAQPAELNASLGAIGKFAAIMLPIAMDKAPQAAKKYQDAAAALGASIGSDLSQKQAREDAATKLDGLSQQLAAMQSAIGLD
jgi:iron uptake system component EfeO